MNLFFLLCFIAKAIYTYLYVQIYTFLSLFLTINIKLHENK